MENLIEYGKERLSRRHCFLCGVKLTSSKSNEHVFPKWLLKRFDLWDRNLILLNKTIIPYRQLVIPCCKPCNNNYLSELEVAIIKIFEKNFSNLTIKEEQYVFQWTSKLLYGILFKELMLLKDRRNPQEGTIISPEVLENFNNLHFLLQSIRKNISFEVLNPWSVFTYDAIGENFFFLDDIDNLSISLKLGCKALIVTIGDWGIVKNNLVKLQEKYGDHCFDRHEFIELTSIIFYMKLLIKKSYGFFSLIDEEDNEMKIFPTGEPQIHDWVDKDFAKFFEYNLERTGTSYEKPIYVEPNTIKSFLVKK